MTKDAFTIIIPYYDNPSLCERLIKELLHQKRRYRQTEILVVDDGSHDGAFLDNISGIRVIHQENRGCPAARNVGLDNADTEYIAFCDCDDMVVWNYLDIIYEQMRRGYDWVSYDWQMNNGAHSEQYTPGYRNNAVWAYTYRKEFIGDLRFDESIRNGSDDIHFIKRLINYQTDNYFEDRRVIYIYYWFGNTNSLQHRVCRGEVV